MPETNIGAAQASNLQNVQTDFSITREDTDAAFEQEETIWTFENWTKWFGYYRQVPELKAVIDAKATWTVGKGFQTTPLTTQILYSIVGWGKDTFNTIIENAIRTYQIGGDFFAEIVRGEDGQLINLKPLDTGAMKIVVNSKGIIKRYEQISKVKAKPKKFEPENIFHLARNRVGDEIHGQSMVEPLVKIIDAKQEAFADERKLMHRHVKPMRIWHLDSDDPSKITAFKTTIDKATEDAENIYLPKDTVEHEIVAVPTNATLSPIPWLEYLDNKFYEAGGVPKIIIGNSSEFTEASAKIAYLAFQQTIEEEQLFIEEQVGLQLGITIELEFPANLENELLSDKKKDGDMSSQPNETTAGSGQ